jgi:hypothetical protein
VSPRRLVLLLSLLGFLAAAAPAQAIVNGAMATGDGAYPWQVAVVMSDDEGDWLCGGTFVAPTLVLTAAHCVVGDSGRIALPGELKVLSGSLDINLTTFSQVSDVALYPGIDLSGTVPSGDVALLRIPPNAPGAPMSVVDEPEASLWDVGDRLRVTGWGLRSATASEPEQILRWASVYRQSDDACATAYGSDFVAATMFCAGDPVAGTDTCLGDSGGPIAASLTPDAPNRFDPANWRLVGVTSWGTGCGDPEHPGVYTRLGTPAIRAFATDPDPVWSPLNTAPPAIPTALTAGQVVTCTPGTWTGEDLTYTYEFHRITGVGTTTKVQAGPSNAYVVTAADAAGLMCVELAHNAGGTRWADSGHASVTVPPVPDVPTTQVPGTETPRTPAPPADYSGVTSGTTDSHSPRASRAAARCRSRRCTVSVRVTDPAPSSGIRRVTGTVTYKQSCRKKGRRTTCTRTRRVSGKKGTGTTWTLKLPRLPRGSATISIIAVDRSGRVQATPAKLRFRVR